VPGSDVGQLFQTILVNQFTRLRDGDRFFYLNETFTPAEQAILNQGNTLAKMIEANTNITNLQSDVFQFKASISGTVTMNLRGNGPRGGGSSMGLAGLTVELEDTSGDVLATTTTGRGGTYSFNQLSTGNTNPELAPGVSATGTYQVVVELPSFLQQLGQGPGAVTVTRGGQNFQNVNFVVGLNRNGMGPQTAQSDLTSLQSMLSGAGTQSTTGGTTGNTGATTGGAATVGTVTLSTSTPGTSSITPSSFLSELESELSSLPASWSGTGATSANAGGSTDASSSSGTNTGVIDSTDSSDAVSGGSGGTARSPTQSLDAAFQEFSKIADQLK
jgi:hypothetical protein